VTAPIVGLVLVTYRSGAVVVAAVETFRRECERAGCDAEVIVVDHSEDARQRGDLEALGADRILDRPNRGYAAGLNAGLAVCRAPVQLVGNPDVVFRRGSVAALLAALDDGWSIVGPLFDLAGALFPPAEEQSPVAELRRWVAALGPSRWWSFVRRELTRSDRVWRGRNPVPVPTLSGALLAFRRDVVEQVGPWDDGYFLHFEESDWLRRARRRGLSIAQVPEARVEHCWGHATEPTLTEQFGRSRLRFYARQFPCLGRMVSRLPAGRLQLLGARWPEGVDAENGLRWLVSPAPRGLPAAWVEKADDPVAAIESFARAQSHERDLTVLAVDSAWDRPPAIWRREPGRLG